MKISAIITNNSNNKVPRPLNCFMTYRLEMQRKILGQCPGANHRDISKITAKWWKDMSHAEKEPYRRRAKQAKDEHRQLYPNYKFAPKKKVTKTRVYKKRAESEYTSEDFKQKEQLDMLYQQKMSTTSLTTIDFQCNSELSYYQQDSSVTIRNNQIRKNNTSSIYRHHGTSTSTTHILPKNKEDYICCTNCFSSPSASSTSSKTCFSKLYHYDLPPTTAKNTTRPAPYSIASQSLSSSPLSSFTSLGHYTTLDKFSLNTGHFKNNNTTAKASLNYNYGSTILQEPPSDPFNSPYSADRISINSRDVRSHPHQAIYHHPSFCSPSSSEQIRH